MLLTFDSERGVIFEFYGIKGKNIKRTFGIYDANDSLNMKGNTYIWKRRADLMGVQLKASVLNWDPISYQSPAVLEHGNEEDTTWRGYFIDVANILKDELNITFIYTSPMDMEWGVQRRWIVNCHDIPLRPTA